MSSFDSKFNTIWWVTIGMNVFYFSAIIVALWIGITHAGEIWQAFLDGIRQIGEAVRGE